MRTPAESCAADHDAGFSLVEVVVAMLVLTVALLALVPVQVKALAGVAAASERQQASAYSSGAVERVRARTLVPAAGSTASGFSTVAAGSDPVLATATATANGTAFTTSVSVADASPASGSSASAPTLIRATATTVWTSRNAGEVQRQVVVQTLIADPGTS